MNYLDKAKDHASMVAYSTKGDEYTFDKTGLEYFLDSLNIDFLAETPKKEWVGLTDEEIIDIWAGVSTGYDDEINIVHLGKAIEAKLKEKNGH